MPSSGPNSPVTVVDDASVGTVAWSNPTRAVSSNNSYATAVLGFSVISHYLKSTEFGFAIPAGNTITGIKVEVEVKTGGPQGILQSRLVKGGVIGSTSKQVLPTSSEAYLSMGGDGDLWSDTWTVDDVNAANFGATVRCTGPGGGTTFSVDHVRITVYYTETATGCPRQMVHLMNQGMA